MKTILVVSHPRSGTHFLIDSIMRNFRDMEFPHIRPSFPSMENLLLYHDRNVSDMFHDYVFSSNGKNRIVKTHILPDEFEMALNSKKYFPNPKDRRIMEHVYFNAEKLYISRDVKDVMVSWFYYHKSGAALHGAMASRIQDATLPEFIRFSNHHIMPCRGFSDFDENLITYWSYHNKRWKEQNVISLQYEDLKCNFERTMRYIASKLNVEDMLLPDITKPPFIKLSSNKWINRIKYRISRKLGITAVQPRKGVVGDHKSHLLPDDYAFIDRSSRIYQ